jgi:hypothetical protein
MPVPKPKEQPRENRLARQKNLPLPPAQPSNRRGKRLQMKRNRLAMSRN